MTNPPDREVGVFNAARRLPAGKRAAYLDEACAGDAALRQRVEELLQASDEAGNFLESPAAVPPGGTVRVPATSAEKPGDRIGRYKLLQQIGEGGCGVVYMAEQEEPVHRRVALKVIKLGMDTKNVIARFEAERQALALMDHPNIAKVLDAGATDAGRPYFVMELVRGIKITDYCDQSNLSTKERLELFIQVCRAIQHAHQKGIIHRDIKPSNILVTVDDGTPLPKVIDFGIAKATQGKLTDQTVFTAFEQFIGTPAYMSPEQAELSARDVDTRSDIYSLGVLLYELLTGRTPFDANKLLQAGLDEIRRTIRQDEPARPSTCLSTMAGADLTAIAKHRKAEPPKLIHLVRGDLDWIVMKALEKDRARRYETANGLATDIQRHINCEAVVARPPSRFYEFQKTVRRHKFGFAATAALITVLAVGVIVSTSEAIRARRAEQEQARLRQQVETEAAKSQQVAQFLEDMLKGVGPSVALGRDTTMLREILDKTDNRIDTELKDQPEVEIELRLTLAQVYFDLQDYRKMEQTARETLRLARAHFGEENLAVADALGQVGRALMFLRQTDEAESLTRQAIAMQRKLRGQDSLQEASALANLDDVLRHQANLHGGDRSKFEEAETAGRAAVAIRRKRLGNDNSEVAWALDGLSITLDNQGKLAEAAAAIREALAIQQKLYGDEHPYTAYAYISFARMLARQDKLEEAEVNFRKGLKTLEKLEGGRQWNQANAHADFADVLQREGKMVEAEFQYREALASARSAMGEDHMDLPQYTAELAGILRKNGKPAEARPLAEEAVAFCERHPGRIDGWMQDRAFGTLRDVLTDLGDTAALEKLELTIRQMDALRKPAATPEPPAK